MIKFLKSLLSRRRNNAAQGLQFANSVTVNEVLTRRPAPPPALRTVKVREARPKLPTKPDPGKRREIDFGIDDLSIAAEVPTNNFNPYDTGRFSATELWEKRHRQENS